MKTNILLFIVFVWCLSIIGDAQAVTHRLPVTKDTSISSVGKEQTGNNGRASRLKLKSIQEYILFDVDVADLKGLVAADAWLHVTSASPAKAPVKRAGVSTVASDWEEGHGIRLRQVPGGACFVQAAPGERDWAYPGSTLMDVVFGRGNTIWDAFAPTVPDRDGGQVIRISPDVVAARVAGISYGFCLYDDVGSEWEETGGRGNHIYSDEENLIRLHGARNEFVGFQVHVVRGSGDISLAVVWENADISIETEIFRFGHVAVKQGLFRTWQVPDPLVPVGEGDHISQGCPPAYVCDFYIPHDAAPGKKRGKLVVRAGDDMKEMDLDLTVWDFTLPDTLSFVPEMNAYARVSPYKGYAYYRLAHQHRTCLNRLPYGWNGLPEFAPERREGTGKAGKTGKSEGTGKAERSERPERPERPEGTEKSEKTEGSEVTEGSEMPEGSEGTEGTDPGFDFTRWNRHVGPLLDGSAFRDLPRTHQPVDVMYLPFSENWPVPLAGNYEKSWWPEEALSDAYREKLAAYFAAFARHIRDRGWDRTEFQFYLNNKVYYREKFAGSSAPWIFDEPVNIQDFTALKWYGDLWHGAVDPVKGRTRQVFRCDISYTQYGRDILWGVSDIDYLGGNNPQKTRMKHEEMVRHPGTRFAEYGTANDLLDANTQPVLWQLSAWAKGAVRVLPWQTIGSAECWEKGEQTALFYPGEFYPGKPGDPGDPGEFYPGQGSKPGPPGAQGANANVEGAGNTERAEDRVYPSIRLKAFRQGQQLIEYLVLLAKTRNVSENTIRHWLTTYLTRQGLQETAVKTHQHDAGTASYKNMTIPDIYHLRFLVGNSASGVGPG